MESSTSLSNQLCDSNSPDTKNIASPKPSSPRFCKAVQASASPSVDVIDTTKKKKSRKNSIRKKSPVFARTVHDCKIEHETNVITEKSEKGDNVNASESARSVKIKHNSRDVRINQESNINWECSFMDAKSRTISNHYDIIREEENRFRPKSYD